MDTQQPEDKSGHTNNEKISFAAEREKQERERERVRARNELKSREERRKSCGLNSKWF
jgi:hypothetical protein